MPSKLAQELSLLAANPADSSLKEWCTTAIHVLPSEAEAARRGNTNVVNKLLGHVMKLSRGTADAKAARTLLQEMLKDASK